MQLHPYAIKQNFIISIKGGYLKVLHSKGFNTLKFRTLLIKILHSVVEIANNL